LRNISGFFLRKKKITSKSFRRDRGGEASSRTREKVREQAQSFEVLQKQENPVVS
jgi:hypothetical protein